MPARPEVLPARLYADLRTVPYLRGGRTVAGMDCVGVFLEIQRRLGVVLPQYASDASVFDLAYASWERLREPVAGAGVLLRSCDPPWHLGVVVGPQTMIHGKEGAGVVVERFDQPQYSRRVEGFYRWRQTAVSGLSA